MRDVNRFLDYYYPHKKDTWIIEHLLTEERFQDYDSQVDCGYHVINFMEAACENTRIRPKGNKFMQYKDTISEIIKTWKENRNEGALPGIQEAITE